MERASERGWRLMLHGGAKAIEPGDEGENRQGCVEALEAGRQILSRGGLAVDAVEAAVRVLETIEIFNAGRGSALTRSGEIEMCAAIMDGSDLRIGAVGAIKRVCHPVSVARTLLPEEPILLVGEGAFMFARDNHAELCAEEMLVTAKSARELSEAHDTVGAVAMDSNGNLASATSTGGLSGTLKGRVGDSPMPGCGYYADNAVGAVAFSGHGEGIARLLLAADVMGALPKLEPEAAVRRAVEKMPRVGGEAGGIAIDRQGRIGWWHNSPHFAVGLVTSDMDEPVVWLQKQEAAKFDG